MVDHLGSHLPKLVALLSRRRRHSVFGRTVPCSPNAWTTSGGASTTSSSSGASSASLKVSPRSLQRGIRVLDVGCGTGHAMNILAREFPASRFRRLRHRRGRDRERAQRKRRKMGLSNVAFEIVDVTQPAQRTAVRPDHRLRCDPRPEIPRCRLARHQWSAGAGGQLPDDRVQVQQPRRGQRREPVRADVLRVQPDALHAGVARRGRKPGSAPSGGNRRRESCSPRRIPDVKVIDTPRPQNCIFVCSN